MKITRQWLQEFVSIEVPSQQLAEQLTMAGLEVESIAEAAPAFHDVVVGEVLEVARHPDAEKLSVCRVTSDGNDELQIVCGAKNVRAGLKVALARVGAELPNGISIKNAKLRGVDSQGMLCSARELGLGSEHEGILELDPSLEIGTDLRAALELDDELMEVKATPNRGDCMSVFGVARDYAAAQHRHYLNFEAEAIPAAHAEKVEVRLQAGDDCPVFGGRVIRGINPHARSPFWLRERLRRVGLNSISAVVDVTNYVMMELGQPMHAYDLTKVKGAIGVRRAKPGERATLLDGKIYSLGASLLVITDAGGVIGLAGIMGGQSESIGDATTDIFFEAAHFAPEAIAGCARQLGLLTDAAQRFERGVDPTLPQRAIERATGLLMQIAGGSPGPTSITLAGKTEQGTAVSLRRERLRRLLGAQIPDADVAQVLGSIAPEVETFADGWSVVVPPHRFDIRIEADLIEEVARLIGFERIEERAAIAPQIPGTATEGQVGASRITMAFADRGYREAITYSFVDPALQRLLFPNAHGLTLSNPISADLSEMRVSLWPGLIRTCSDNLRRQQPLVRAFEIGRKYEVREQGLHEIDTVAGIAAGSRWPEQWSVKREPVDFFDVKSDVLDALALAGSLEAITWAPESNDALRPGRSARIYRDGRAIGWLGELHPRVVKGTELTYPALVFELELERAFASKVPKLQQISKFPSVRRDIAVVVDESVTFAQLKENVSVSASGVLQDLLVFDVYRGPGIDSGRKSVALGLILQDSSRTLTDVDSDAVVAAVVARLRDELSANIRDQ